MRKTLSFATALALLAGPAVRADTVEVTSTTFVTAGQQTRGGTSGQSPRLDTVVPAFELLSINASNVTNPLVDDLRIVLQTWGAVDLGDRRFNAGVEGDFTGDVMVGYLQGRLGDAVLLRLGRQNVALGVGRMLHVDGGDVVLFGPAGVQLSAYAGVPVAQRFSYRGTLQSWNPAGGDLAYGGRLGWSLALPGVAGKGLDLGVSANFVEDGGDAVREEIGVDARFRPIAPLTFTGFGAYSLYDEAFTEAQVLARVSATRKLGLTADWRYVNPGLLLVRNSLFSVFSDDAWNSVGVGADYEVRHGVTIGADYRAVLEPKFEGLVTDAGNSAGEADMTRDGIELGNDVSASLTWERGGTLTGLELSWLDSSENGWVGGRVFGRQAYGKLFVAADVLAHLFREEVNGEDLAVTGSLTAGYELLRGLSAVISGRAGVTPFLEQQYDVMAKLMYNQVYRAKEVR